MKFLLKKYALKFARNIKLPYLCSAIQKIYIQKMIGSIDYNARLIDYFNSLGEFEIESDIPPIPNVDVEIYNNNILPNLLRCGAIDKKNLIINKMYKGSSKLSKEAMWKGNFFICIVDKWGTQSIKKINHFQDYNGGDIFIPIEEIC